MAITITYNGTTQKVDDGKTATLACGGKIMISDVVIALAAETNGYTVNVIATTHNDSSSKIYLKDGYDEAVSPTNYDVVLNGGETGAIQVASGYLSVYAYSSATHSDFATQADARGETVNTPADDPAKVYSQYNLDANGSWKGIFEITQDIPNYLLGFYLKCFVEGTQITLANGSTKAVEDITYEDELLVWNFYDGTFATAKPFWIMQPAVAPYYYKVTLDNGNTIKLVGSDGNCHRVFSVTKNQFAYATLCVGDEIYTEDGIFQMISCERIEETVRYYNLKTEKYHNCFANGILTCGRYGNLFDIADMKYCSNVPNFTEAELAEREAVWESIRLPK